jgi:periplasmic protein CpxP/Spy
MNVRLMMTWPVAQIAQRLVPMGLLAACLSTGMIVPSPSVAQNPTPVAPGQERPMRGRGQGDLLQQLNLTPEQTRQVQEIRQRSKPKMQQTRQNMMQARRELEQLMNSNASERQIQDKFRQVQSLKQEMATLRMENLLAIRAVLTPEQRQQYATLMQQRRQMRRQRPNRGPQNPQSQAPQSQAPQFQEFGNRRTPEDSMSF